MKSNKNFKDLSNQLTQIENDIANSRKYYNRVIRIFNNKVEMFLSNIFSKLFGYKFQSMCKAMTSKRENVKVKL